MIIRHELPADIDAIFALTEEAFRPQPFRSGTEQMITNALRDANALTLSLVAERDGEIIGHVAFSPVTISDGSRHWYGLGPVAVRAQDQRRGVGTALIREGLALIVDHGATGCVLLGDPAYYQRFGFRNDPKLLLPGIPPEYFMALRFGDDAAHGTVAYHLAFAVTA